MKEDCLIVIGLGLCACYFVTFQVKSRTKAEGLQQMENAVYGLWAEGQQSMIGVLSVDGKVSDYIAIIDCI
jgi:hypothetical protein